MYKAAGYDDEALSKPLIGIANTWTEIGPCNFHLRQLAEFVKKGVREAGGTPLEYNTITVSEKESLLSTTCKVSNLNWLIDSDPSFPLNLDCQIRYNGKISSAKLDYNPNNEIVALFDEPQLAITPGQSIVFYNNEQLLGGGIIELYNNE